METQFLNAIKSNVLKFDPNARIILFGSRARGDYKPDSDWDVLILLSYSESESIKKLIRDNLFLTELEFNQPISSIIYSKEKWENLAITPLHKNIDIEGVVI